MKKIISLLAALAAGFGFVSAQNFTVTCNGKTIENGDTIEIREMAGSDEMEADFMIASTSTANVDFSMNFEEVQPENATITICGFGGCRAGNSIENETLEPGKTYGGEGDKIDIAYLLDENAEKVTMKVTMSDNTAGENLVFTLVFAPKSQETANRVAFTVTCDGKTIENGDTIEIHEMAGSDEMEADFMITSTSDADIDFSMRFEEVQPENATITICGFGGCRAGNSIDNETLEPGKTYGGEGDKIDIAYLLGENAEKVTMKVIMSDSTAEADLVFTLIFDPTRGAANQTVAEVIAAAYPNPASEVVKFRLNNVKAGAVVVLRDLSGKALRQVVAADEVSMNLQGLSAGMYFYTVEEQGVRMATGKLVIR